MIGIDILEIDRLKNLNFELLLSKVFTEYEREYISSKNDKYSTAAGIFCCKEAAIKVLGEFISLKKLLDIEVRHEASGKPYIVLHNKMREKLYTLGYNKIEISISHSKNIATAVAIATLNI